ncbi:MAG: PD-(D/E)XK nuclease family protein [Candidatus Caccovivens sp.]
MEIKLIVGGTTYEAGVNTIKQIDVTDRSRKHIVVVPDSFSMQAESLIFDCLKIKSTFNIEVVGISRLASKILRQNNVSFKRISGLEETFNIYNAVKENENQFVYFHKCGVDLCLKILQIIKQFKACHIRPEQIKPTGEEFLDGKMHDLKLIYQSFERLLSDKLDLSKLLEFFIENAKNNLDLSKINLYFANFDSFSPEINDFICKLAGLVNKVCIGMASPVSAGNAFIYENDIFKKTAQYAKEYGISVSVEKFPISYEGARLKMLKNLFAFNVETGKDDYFTNIIAKNKDDEIEFVAKYIKYQIFHGARLKNFAVAVSDDSYYEKIKTIFSKFGLLAYCDDATNLSETVLGEFLQKIMQIARFGFNKENIEFLVSHILTSCDEKEKILSEIFFYNIQDEGEFLVREPNYKKLFSFISQLKKCKNTHDFVFVLKQILQETNEKQQFLLNLLKEEQNFKKESENAQSAELLLQVLDKLDELGVDQPIEFEDFEKILALSLQSVKVETIPSYVDAVFVGDATSSYFEDVDTLFVLGATASALPKVQKDTALIDDEEIKKLRLQFAIEPEIKVLNRRNRLKLFECLFHAKNHLIVCQPLSLEGKSSQCAGFVQDLCTMFGDNVVQTESLTDIDINLLNDEEKLNKMLFYLGSSTNLRDAYAKLAVKGDYNLSVNLIPEKKQIQSIQIGLRNKISASELENYFACPFKRFVSYDLKIKQKENIEPNKRIFGTFEHTLLEKFVSEFKNELFKLDEIQIDEFLSKNLKILAEKIYDKKVIKPSFLKILKNESKIILKNIVFEQKNSDFRPILLEEKIFVPLTSDVNLVGFVDRIDKWKDNFRILDYKTGKTESIKKELFYGKKLQLFLYASAVQKKLGLNCSGVYYFDCQTKYKKQNISKNLLNGLTTKDNDIVLATDTRLWQDGFKSDLIGMSRKVNVKDDEFAFKNGNGVENMQELFDYAQRLSTDAMLEIQNGYIKPKPFANECEFCPYFSICRHEIDDGFRQMQSVKDEDLRKGKMNED